MSVIQKIVLAVGIMIAALSVSVPPWVYTFQAPGMKQATRPAGYYFIFYAPDPGVNKFYGVQIDHSRLIAQTLATIFITIAALVIVNILFKSKSK